MDSDNVISVVSTHSEKKDGQHLSRAWRKATARLAYLRDMLEQETHRTPEETAGILKQRAHLLAQETSLALSDASDLEVIRFQLGEDVYAFEAGYVREVFQLKELTPLPCTPPFILGIINVRGQVLSVMDLKIFFNLPEKGITNLNKLIILHKQGMVFGVLADVILGTHAMLVRELQLSLPTLTDVQEKYLKGVTKDRMVILDAEKLLSDTDTLVHEEVVV
jgi:purine-binding chemotaxis protein CheW